MDSKIKKLINKLNLQDECKKVLENAKLEKIVANKEKTNYCFYIEIDNILNLDLYEKLNTNFKKAFNTVDNVSVVFSARNKSNELIQDCVKRILEFYSKESSMLSMFLNNKIELDKDNVLIYVDNVAEQKKLGDYKLKIEEYLNRVGYSGLKVEIKIDEEETLKLQEEIENSKVNTSNVDLSKLKEEVKEVNTFNWKKNYMQRNIETVDDPNVILGRVIDTDVSRIDTLTGKVPQITFEAEVFGIDIKETKTELRIFTIKITDRTDSMYAKLFVNGEEETKRLSKLIKEGKWYKFRGQVKEDKFSGEDVLNITDINISNPAIIPHSAQLTTLILTIA